MIKTGDYQKLKNVLQEEFEGQRITIHIKGQINTNVVLENVKIMINKSKLILVDENNNFELEFLMIKKIHFEERWCIEISYDEFVITIEI